MTNFLCLLAVTWLITDLFGEQSIKILLFTIAAILGLGFVAVCSILVEIRDALAESCEYVKRVADAMDEDDLAGMMDDEDVEALRAASDYWSKAGYGSGKGKPPGGKG